jgi:hypothetical protein
MSGEDLLGVTRLLLEDMGIAADQSGKVDFKVFKEQFTKATVRSRATAIKKKHPNFEGNHVGKYMTEISELIPILLTMDQKTCIPIINRIVNVLCKQSITGRLEKEVVRHVVPVPVTLEDADDVKNDNCQGSYS